MDAGAAFRACLRDGDVEGMCAVWKQVYPEMPAPGSEAEARVVLHRARTEAASLDLAARLYSHRWLEERGLPSGLPEDMVPSADRPVVISAVGISVVATNPARAEEAKTLKAILMDTVEDMYASGQTDPTAVARRMDEVTRAFKQNNA